MADVEVGGGSGFGGNILPGYCSALKLQPVGTHVTGDIKER